MAEKTLKADDEKRTRIIEAAISEFGERGYRHGSTNRIVEKADVSKGLLFHYFGSKKDLYLQAYDYATCLLTDEFVDKFDLEEKDIFKRWASATLLKLEMIRRYDGIFEFILDAYARTDDDVRGEVGASTESWLKSTWEAFQSGLDFSMFREGLDVRKAINVIYWTIEGYSKSRIKPMMRVADYEAMYGELIGELGEYMDILRKSFYKSEHI